MRGRDTHYELVEHISDVTKLPVVDTEWLQPQIRCKVAFGNVTAVVTAVLEKSGYDSRWRISSLKTPSIVELS